MPNFPTYRGELPNCLNPLNLRHYLLLAYWINFRPTGLNCYLYQAAPDSYRSAPELELDIFYTLRIPAYRNFYIIISIATLFIITVLSVFLNNIHTNTLISLLLVLIASFISATYAIFINFYACVFFEANKETKKSAVNALIRILILTIIILCYAIFLVIRVVLFFFQIVLAWRSKQGKAQHPLEWDELMVFPLPSARQALVSRLQQNEVDGLRLIANVARNPFQRNVAQSALLAHLHDYAKPLDFLYELLTNDELNEYAFVPVTKLDWERLGTQRDLLLGELAGKRVGTDRVGHRVVWGLTGFLRGRDEHKTRLTRFAGLLYDLMDKKKVVAPDFNLSSYEPAYIGVSNYPGGLEIAGSFELLATFLSYNTLSALSSATALTSDLTADEAAIRPSVLKGLAQLGQVGMEVAAYQASTSRVNKLAALARATDILNELDKEVVAEVMVPEQTILRRIIRQWGGLISKEGGEVGRAEEIGPVANPYVAGNPVTGELFVGREEIMRRLEELWGAVEVPSVVLYGHRRMGKSSILRNLGARFGTNATVVDFNMQRVGHVANTGELLHNLSLALYDSLAPVQQEELGEPEEERFLKHNPYTAFDRFLKQLDRLRADQRFIITVDEFELIEVAISEGRLEARLLDFWRGLIQTYPWFVMAFAGLHTLREMTQDYWHPLFGSVTTIPVSFIRPKAARRLIIQPTADFPLDYDEEAIAQIITLTNGQPYLIQLICHALVTRFNRQTFEEGVERERRLTIADLEAVINAPEFYRDGHFYFIGVWGQAETGTPDTQTTVLRALAPSETALPAATIAQRAKLPLAEASGALKALQSHDVLKKEHERWRFTVELMRRWVVEKKIGAS